MTPRPMALKLMIMDACVLIDFIKADRTILELIGKYVGRLHVVSATVVEVKDIRDENELIELGLVVIEPEMEDAYAAASASGPTSFQDRLCLLTAKRQGFICVTNDKNLRGLCQKEHVVVQWGLELIASLHKAGGISSEDAIEIAKTIHQSNPKHITTKIVERFTENIQKQKTGV